LIFDKVTDKIKLALFMAHGVDRHSTSLLRSPDKLLCFTALK